MSGYDAFWPASGLPQVVGDQIVGDQIVGYDESGRRVSKGPANQRPQQYNAALMPSQKELQYLVAGLPRQAVAAAGVADLQCTVSESFRPDRLILSVAAQALDVTNIRIGTKLLNVTSNPISGNCFSEQAVGSTLRGWTAQPGVGFVVSVQNNTIASITTGGGVFGPSATSM